MDADFSAICFGVVAVGALLLGPDPEDGDGSLVKSKEEAEPGFRRRCPAQTGAGIERRSGSH